MTSIPQTPDWPGLYDPFVDLLNIPHRDSVQPSGRYLYDAGDVFTFTLYWNFIFYLPLFVLAGFFAFLNLVFPPQRIRSRERALARDGESYSSKYAFPREPEQLESHPLAPMITAGSSVAYSPAASPSTVAFPTGTDSAPKSGPSGSMPLPTPLASLVTPTTSGSRRSPSTPSKGKGKGKGIEVVNPQRSRVAFALIVLVVYLGAGLIGAVVGSAIVGYILAGLFQSGGFVMSTWIPLIFALVQTLIGVLGIYPSVAEII